MGKPEELLGRLILTLDKKHRIKIGDAFVYLRFTRGNNISLCIEAPKEIKISREKRNDAKLS